MCGNPFSQDLEEIEVVYLPPVRIVLSLTEFLQLKDVFLPFVDDKPGEEKDTAISQPSSCICGTCSTLSFQLNSIAIKPLAGLFSI
jgi:hypothetical protein